MKPSPKPRTPAPSPRIPLNVVTGSLGSGKTTLIARLLREGIRGLRPAVLVNEVGDVAIDGAILGGLGSEITELPSGCICCMVSDDLRAVVEQVLERDPDMLIIETSGAAYPDPLLYSLMGLGLTIDAVITLADAVHLHDLLESSEVTLAQLQAADCIVLNKIDLVDESAAEEREQFLRREFDASLVLPTSEAAVDISVLFGSNRSRPRSSSTQTPGPADGILEHQHRIGSLVVDVPGAVDPRAISPFLRRLPKAAFRVKGILDVNGQPTILNAVGGRGRLAEVLPADTPTGKLVFIGQDLPAHRHAIEAAVAEELRRC